MINKKLANDIVKAVMKAAEESNWDLDMYSVSRCALAAWEAEFFPAERPDYGLSEVFDISPIMTSGIIGGTDPRSLEVEEGERANGYLEGFQIGRQILKESLELMKLKQYFDYLSET
jgi:hypothetical protein